jgi:hypothetical protein
MRGTLAHFSLHLARPRAADRQRRPEHTTNLAACVRRRENFRRSWRHFHSGQLFCQLKMPSPCGLLQTIQALGQVANPLVPRLIKSHWLLHIDFLCNRTIEERSFDIYLVNFMLMHVGYSKQQGNGRHVTGKRKTRSNSAPLICFLPSTTSLALHRIIPPLKSRMRSRTHTTCKADVLEVVHTAPTHCEKQWSHILPSWLAAKGARAFMACLYDTGMSRVCLPEAM